MLDSKLVVHAKVPESQLAVESIGSQKEIIVGLLRPALNHIIEKLGWNCTSIEFFGFVEHKEPVKFGDPVAAKFTITADDAVIEVTDRISGMPQVLTTDAQGTLTESEKEQSENE